MNKKKVIDCSKIWNNEKTKEVIKQSKISEHELESFTNFWNNLDL